VDTGDKGVVARVLAKVGRILVEHLDSIVDVPPQLGHFSKAVNPVNLRKNQNKNQNRKSE